MSDGGVCGPTGHAAAHFRRSTPPPVISIVAPGTRRNNGIMPGNQAFNRWAGASQGRGASDSNLNQNESNLVWVQKAWEKCKMKSKVEEVLKRCGRIADHKECARKKGKSVSAVSGTLCTNERTNERMSPKQRRASPYLIHPQCRLRRSLRRRQKWYPSLPDKFGFSIRVGTHPSHTPKNRQTDMEIERGLLSFPPIDPVSQISIPMAYLLLSHQVSRMGSVKHGI